MLSAVFSETAAQYEARIAVLQSQPVEWKRAGGPNMVSTCVTFFFRYFGPPSFGFSTC